MYSTQSPVGTLLFHFFFFTRNCLFLKFDCTASYSVTVHWAVLDSAVHNYTAQYSTITYCLHVNYTVLDCSVLYYVEQ